MIQKTLLEICANSLTSALEAQSGGADRIELCESLELGGITPSYGTLKLCRKKLTIPIHVLIRPRGGDFLYSEEEFDVMKEDIVFCKSIGINGIVTGILTPDGNIDKVRCAQLKVLAEPMSISFHRAFDFCRNPLEALEDLIEIGYERILTAGQQNTVIQGTELIKTLVSRANGRIIIMPGSGVDETNIRHIIDITGASEVHTTARKSQDGPMAYRKENVNLSVNLNQTAYERVHSDSQRIRKLKALIVALFCLTLPIAHSQVVTRELNSGWAFRLRSQNNWFDAKVPGTLHTDLMQNGLIADPYWGNNEKEIQSLESEGMEYLGRFEVSNELYDFHHVEIVFEGIDTYASVWMNKAKLFDGDNMFRKYHIDVKSLLNNGKNELNILIDPAVAKGKRLAETNHLTLPGDEKVYTRKAAYQYGWDWGPRLVTAGIWRPVRLIAWNKLILRDAFIRQESLTKDKAKLVLKTSVDCEHAGEYTLVVKDKHSGKEYLTKKVIFSQGFNTIESEILLLKPKLWWCKGMGEANLYRFIVGIYDSTNLISQKDLNIGLRTIEIIREKDNSKQPESGTSFYVKLNGFAVFMKGANYIPPDNFMPRVDSARYADILDQAIKSNMNMLRVWGGGNYESDVFYDLCDEKGILIWQDFMFACAMYPGDSAFLKNVRQEAYDNVLRLRQHPCIALWCGNNEVDEGWKNWGWQKQYKYSSEDSAKIWQDYMAVFHGILPNVVKELDPERFYWPSSPSIGWGRKESMIQGDSHYWGVWWGMEPFSVYEKKVGRFMSEYGFQGFPDLLTIAEFTKPADRVLGSEVMKNHQKHSTGYETIQAYMEREFRQPKDFEQYIYVSQLLQAGGIGRAIEAHRIARPRCMGTLYWQLNDCWPVVSWSGMDYKNRWKALQYKVRETYAPIMLKAVWKENSLDVFIDNQRMETVHGTLFVEMMDFDGKVISEFSEKNISIPANMLFSVYPSQKPIIEPPDTSANFLVVRLEQQGMPSLQKTVFFCEPKSLSLLKTTVTPTITAIPGGYSIQIKSTKLAKNVWLRLRESEGFFKDNYFDLVPGKQKTVICKTQLSMEDFKQKLVISSLVDSY